LAAIAKGKQRKDAITDSHLALNVSVEDLLAVEDAIKDAEMAKDIALVAFQQE